MGSSTHRRSQATLVLALLLGAGVASCSSNGVDTESSSPRARPPDSSASATGPSRPEAPTSSSSTTETVGFGDAQPAVDAFAALTKAYNEALRNPAATSPTAFNEYVAGQAKNAYDASLADEKAQGRAFRGTPPANRLIVKSSDVTTTVPTVTLENCVLLSTTHPWTEYTLATGKAVPTSAPVNVSPPYPTAIKMFKPTAAGWVATSFTTDPTKTCTR